jgi:hypothetical protein
MKLSGDFGLVNEILWSPVVWNKKGKAYGKGDYQSARFVEAYMVVFI